MQQPWLIATDLDGTLLDDSYPEQQAAQAIDQLQLAHPQVEVALVSSKTFAEMSVIGERTQQQPFLIFENGGGVAWPSKRFVTRGDRTIRDYEVVLLGATYQAIILALKTLRSTGFKFCGFADMSTREVADHTLLSLWGARRACQRMCSEPLLWQEEPERLAAFSSALKLLGFTLQRGGRFYHVTSGSDKIKALDHLRQLVRFETGRRMRLLACGDAPNDLAMLDNADHALVFPDRSGRYLRDVQDDISHAPGAGPHAWLTCVTQLVNQVHTNMTEAGQQS